VTSPAMQNGFCVKRNLELHDGDKTAFTANVEASLILGSTTMGGRKGKKLETSPATVDFSRIELDLLLK